MTCADGGRVPLTVVDPWDPEGGKVGGAETFLRALIGRAPEDFDVRVVGITSDRAARPLRRWTRAAVGPSSVPLFPVLATPDENRKRRIPLSLRFALAWRSSAERRPAGLLFFNRIEIAAASGREKRPRVAVIHNDVPQQVLKPGGEVLWNRAPRLYLAMERRVVPRLDLVWSVSRSTIAHLARRFPDMNGRLRALTSFVDPETFRPDPGGRPRLRDALARRFGFPADGGPWVVFAGRLQRQKAPLRMVEAFARSRAGTGAGRLIVAGDGNLRAETEAHAAALGVGARVSFTGALGRAELADLYRAGDAFLLASDYEGTPFSVVEALASGLPVVSTDVGEIRSMVRPGVSGEITAAKDAGEIAAALDRVLERPEAYPPEACVASAAAYGPGAVLEPVYEDLRQIGRRGSR